MSEFQKAEGYVFSCAIVLLFDGRQTLHTVCCVEVSKRTVLSAFPGGKDRRLKHRATIKKLEGLSFRDAFPTLFRVPNARPYTVERKEAL